MHFTSSFASWAVTLKEELTGNYGTREVPDQLEAYRLWADRLSPAKAADKLAEKYGLEYTGQLDQAFFQEGLLH